MQQDKPRDKPPEVEFSCRVWITHIKFNYDQTSLSNDALNIRLDRLHEVPVPEWDQSKFRPEESPAAYALRETSGHMLYILARFEIDPPAPDRRGRVKAKGGGILGAIDSVGVQFVNGVSHDPSHGGDQEYVRIPLRHRSFSAITRRDIRWDWFYQCPHSGRWLPMDETRHRIYVVLKEPPEPWSQMDPQVYPWTTALDYSVVNANTRGIRDAGEAAARIVQHVNGEPLKYDTVSGRARYYAGSFFSGVFGIDDWLGGFAKGNIVNCYDCASAVTTFSNVLGCHLSYQFHEPFGYLHPVYPIGRGLCNNPFYDSPSAQYHMPLAGVDDAARKGFRNHAYSKQAGNNYDSCMRGSLGCARALGYYILAIMVLISTLGMAASLAKRLFLKGAGWLIDMSQSEYEGIVLDKSTPVEAAAADGGAPSPLPLGI